MVGSKEKEWGEGIRRRKLSTTELHKGKECRVAGGNVMSK